jgi:type IV secretion system protein VirB9
MNFQGLKLMSRIFLLILSLVLLSQSAFSAQLPRYLGSERKFRSFVYNPNDVYRYIGHYTYQGFIEFEEDETISTISMGDPTLWLFESLANRLFLKPVGEDHSETNMTVITNKKVYHFELLAREAKGITDEDLIFVVKFVYPDEKDKNIVQFPKFPQSDEPDLRDLTAYSFNYQYTGEASIAPVRVFDNGEFTYFQFSKKNAEIPAIFTVDAEGFESLINFRAAGSYIIVERVSSQFTLRNGTDIVCVYNMDLYASGRANQSTVKRREDGTLNSRRFSGVVDPAPQITTPNLSPYPPTNAPQDPTIPPSQTVDVPPGFPSELIPKGSPIPSQRNIRMPGTFF